MTRITLATSLSDLTALAEPLNALTTACRARAFTAPSFLLPWARTAMQDGQVPQCLALWDGPDLAGFVPLFLRRDRKALMARRLAPPRFGSSPPFEFLIAPGADADRVIEQCAQHVAAMPWLDQTFANEPVGSRLSGAWADRFGALGFDVSRTAESGYMMVRGVADSAAYLAGMNHKARRNLERLERRFAEQGEIALFSGQGDPAPALDAMHQVISASWKDSPHMRRLGLPLLAELTQTLGHAGRLRLWFARSEGQPVAFLMEIADETGSRHAYFNAQNPVAASLGPGTSIFFAAVRASLDAGVPEYDFWGNRRYLRHLANDLRETERVSITRKGAISGLQGAVLSYVTHRRNHAA